VDPSAVGTGKRSNGNLGIRDAERHLTAPMGFVSGNSVTFKCHVELTEMTYFFRTLTLIQCTFSSEILVMKRFALPDHKKVSSRFALFTA
jgi:hypothetical protein